jgi:glucose-1-phosphate thymidylyltransferase
MTQGARTTQALILAAGLGTRMRRASSSDATTLSAEQRAAADDGAKGMMPFGRPFLDYVISALADAGITKVVLLTSPGGQKIRDYFTKTAPPTRVSLHLATQAEPRGTADAVLCAREALGDQPFLILNSDNYYPVEAFRQLADVGGAGLVAFDADTLIRESGIEAERVLRYALLDVDENGWLRNVYEKPSPDHPLAQRAERWVSMNLWSFTSRIFEACERVQPSARGELEIQDAVTIAMTQLGERFRVVNARAGVLDLSSRADVDFVGRRLAQIDARP